MSNPWSNEELAAAVQAYREMQANDAAGTPYSKAAYHRRLAAQYGRTEQAFDFRMRNISAVLEDMNKPWLRGYAPAKNVGANVAPRLVDLLSVRKADRLEPEVKSVFKEKLPLMRDWLISLARSRTTVTYEQMIQVFGLDHASLRDALKHLDRESGQLREPLISSLIVSENTGKCSSDFFEASGVKDDETERECVRAHWAEQPSADSFDFDELPNESLEVRAIKFATVARRPDQAAFRKAVYEAYGGKCAITGCGLGAALDAAHRHGCDWRDGHNRSTDGLLLRKDLHALYDRHLLNIDANGIVDLTDEVLQHYPELAGRRIGA